MRAAGPGRHDAVPEGAGPDCLLPTLTVPSHNPSNRWDFRVNGTWYRRLALKLVWANTSLKASLKGERKYTAWSNHFMATLIAGWSHASALSGTRVLEMRPAGGRKARPVA